MRHLRAAMPLDAIKPGTIDGARFQIAPGFQIALNRKYAGKLPNINEQGAPCAGRGVGRHA